MNFKKLALILCISITISCQTQETIDFKVSYLPNLHYTLTQNQVSENKVEYKGSEEILDNLKNNGVENPTISKTSGTLKSISKTGELIGNEFSLHIDLLESSNPRLKSGTKFYGKSIEGLTKIDSISSYTMTEENKNTLLITMESMMNQNKYPERKIKVGERFEQNNPMSIPIANVTIEIEINSIYTLIKVESGLGYFDLAQV